MDEHGPATQLFINLLKNYEWITDVNYADDIVSCIIEVPMPSRAKVRGISTSGVKSEEKVEFHLSKDFPHVAPLPTLRKDFPQNFPHLNPSRNGWILPCIYEGNINELFQSSNGPRLFLEQMRDWLKKAATNSLHDMEQGWEPMRTDLQPGFIEISSAGLDTEREYHQKIIREGGGIGRPADVVIDKNGGVFAFMPMEQIQEDKQYNGHLVMLEAPEIIDEYFPSNVQTLQELYTLAKRYKLSSIKDIINQAYFDQKLGNRPDALIICIAVHRPAKVINPLHQTDFEYLFFSILCKTKGRKKDALYEKSRATRLAQIEPPSAKLLRNLSGKYEKNQYPLVFVGCGSLGSKISVHLARSGCENLSFIDNDILYPHNFARHGLLTGQGKNKAMAMAGHLSIALNTKIGVVSDQSIFARGVSDIDDAEGIIIDSTASFVVRNYLASQPIKTPVISVSLFGHGAMGVMLIESYMRSTRVDDLAARCHGIALENPEFAKHYVHDQISYQRTGIGCGSATTVAGDADISLSAAAMANKINRISAQTLPEKAQICYGIMDDEKMGMHWETIELEPTIVLPGSDGEMEVRISGNVAAQMREEFNANIPNETGGVLVGHVSIPMQTIYITSLIPAPADSKRTPSYFELGTDGLVDQIANIEKLNSPLRALGTWHTHPKGGGPSQTDRNTKAKIEKAIGEDTVCCLIMRPDDINRF